MTLQCSALALGSRDSPVRSVAFSLFFKCLLALAIFGFVFCFLHLWLYNNGSKTGVGTLFQCKDTVASLAITFGNARNGPLWFLV